MEKKRVKELRKLLYPVIKLKPYVKALWEKDGEIIILVDDSMENEKHKAELDKVMCKLSRNIKFGKVKHLSLWWEMLRLGESKTLNDMKFLNIISDSADYVKLFKSMVDNNSLFPSNKKADMLFERSQRHLDKNESILLNNVSAEIYNAMKETAQAILLYDGLYVSSGDKALEALEKYRPSLSAPFREMHKELKALASGNRFSAADAGYFISKAKTFLFDAEDHIIHSEKDRSDRVMHEAYKLSMRLCKKALNTKIKALPLRDDEKISCFKKHFADTGEIDSSHISTLNTLYAYNRASRKDRLALMNDKCLDRLRIQNMTLAMQEMVR